jgi:hypothetical protein
MPVTITVDDSAERVTVEQSPDRITISAVPVATQTPWGGIAGTLADQVDLSAALAAKASATDPRLTDARTPTAHAASHATAGSDPVTLTTAQVTGLPAAVSALAAHLGDTANPHATTAAQAGADPAGTAASSVSTHNALATAHDATATGRAVLTAVDAAAARSAISAAQAGAAPATHATSHQPGGSDALAVNAAAGTGSLRSLGTGSTQACAGNDSRLSNARAPTSHASSHQPGGGDALAVDAAAATGSLRTLGTGATQACAGADARLSNARTPTAHATSHRHGGSDELATATPTANAIPKADASGKLDAWVSAAFDPNHLHNRFNVEQSFYSLSADTHDISGTDTVLWNINNTASAPIDITGMVPIPDTTCIRTIRNNWVGPFWLVSQDSRSASANQFDFSPYDRILVPPGASVDVVSSGVRWSLLRQQGCLLPPEITQHFGDGSDGDASITTGTTITLTKNTFYNNLTISGTGRLETNGFLVYVRGVLDLTAAGEAAIGHQRKSGINGVLQNGGSNGVAPWAPFTGSAGYLRASVGGTAGGTSTTTTGGNSVGTNDYGVNNYCGGAGAIGGLGGAGTYSAGNAGNAQYAVLLRDRFNPLPASLPIYIAHGSFVGASYGAGHAGSGGSAGGGNNTNYGGGGGGGGAGGAMVVVHACIVLVSSSTAVGAIDASGGHGGHGADGSGTSNTGGGGGGGAGGGGIAVLHYGLVFSADSIPAGIVRADGGNGGNGGDGTTGRWGGDGGSGGMAGIAVAAGLSNQALGISTSGYAAGQTGINKTGTTGGAGGAGGQARVSPS